MKRSSVWAMLPLLALCSCVPWTVRPIEQGESGTGQGRARFNAAAYVDSIWNAKVLPAALGQSVDLSTLIAALRSDPAAAARQYGHKQGEGAACFLVRGRGRVLRIDTASQSGRLTLDLPPYDGRSDAAIQIGPAIRGTALRDALPFIDFAQFVNQLDFADVGNELNSRAVQAALAPVALKELPGKPVSFWGACPQPASDAVPEIVPVKLVVERGAE
jgi:predicted lipoprotein